MKNKPLKDIHCHNCHKPLQGDENFCPYCGQKNDIRPLSIKHYISTVFGNFFNFDNKIWRTSFGLLKHPAQIAKDFIQGKRVTYSNPFRFLIQVSILYFILSGIVAYVSINKMKGNFIKVEFDAKEKAAINAIDQRKSVFLKKIDSTASQTNFIEKLKSSNLSHKEKDSILQQLLNLEHNHFSTEFINGQLINHKLDTYLLLQEYLKAHNINYSYYPALQDTLNFETKKLTDKMHLLSNYVSYEPYISMPVDSIIKHLHIQNNLNNKILISAGKRFYTLLDNPEIRKTYQKSVMSKVTMGLFFVLPLFTFFVFLFYFKKGISYTDTLVFIFYLQSVYFILSIFALLSEIILPSILNLTINIIIDLIFYFILIVSFKKFYQEKNFSNFLKINLFIIPVYLLLTGIGLAILSVLALII